MHQPADFFNTFIAMYRPFTNHTNHILEKHELSNSYWRLLRVLENGESKNFNEITLALNVEKPAVTKIIKRLAELTIVEIYSGQDKRQKMVRLTAYGKIKMAEIRDDLNPFLEALLQGLRQEQLENAMDVIDAIRENIKKY